MSYTPSHNLSARATQFMRDHTEAVGRDDVRLADECMICLEGYTNETAVRITLPGCNHIIGKECLKTFLTMSPNSEKKCPLCRTMWLPMIGVTLEDDEASDPEDDTPFLERLDGLGRQRSSRRSAVQRPWPGLLEYAARGGRPENRAASSSGGGLAQQRQVGTRQSMILPPANEMLQRSREQVRRRLLELQGNNGEDDTDESPEYIQGMAAMHEQALSALDRLQRNNEPPRGYARMAAMLGNLTPGSTIIGETPTARPGPAQGTTIRSSGPRFSAHESLEDQAPSQGESSDTVMSGTGNPRSLFGPFNSAPREQPAQAQQQQQQQQAEQPVNDLNRRFQVSLPEGFQERAQASRQRAQAREQAFQERERALDQREQTLNEREHSLTLQGQAMEQRQQALNQRERLPVEMMRRNIRELQEMLDLQREESDLFDE